MKIDIRNLFIKLNPMNEVKSNKVLRSRKTSDNGRILYDEDGIFSDKIFGSIDECKCRTTQADGSHNLFCPKCGQRVVPKENIPDFYFTMPCKLGRINIDYSIFPREDQEIIESLIRYEGYIFDGEFEHLDITKDLSRFEGNDDKIFYGLNGILKAKELGLIKTYMNKEELIEWYNYNTIQHISIPHTSFRAPIINEDNKIILGDLNECIIKILNYINSFKNNTSENEDLAILLINNYNMMTKLYDNYLYELYSLIAGKGKNSLMNKELISQPITGAIRAVIINNYELDEDTVIIGKELAPTLWPMYFEGKNNDLDVINKQLKEDNKKVIINRPPTIGQKSVLTMNPVISKEDSQRFVLQTNPIIFDGLAADTDGDQFLTIALYTKDANIEASKLLPSRNYLGVNNGKIRNKIPEDLMYCFDMWIPDEKKGKYKGITQKDLENMSREEYIEFYQWIGPYMWEYNVIPTVGDIAKHLMGEENKKFSSIVEYTNNEEKIEGLLNKTDIQYTDSESLKHINKVNASNNTEIKDSGYFYKKLMSSTDDIRIIDEDCGSKGREFKVSDITEDEFDFKIRFSYVVELEKYASMNYESFMEEVKDLESINVRSILYCNHAKDRKCCHKCAGTYMLSKDEEFTPIDLGIFSTLMITEHATQASLDSMNKGQSENLNKILEQSLGRGYTWQEVIDVINGIINKIGWIGVQSRFYEVALLSRFFKEPRYNKDGSLKEPMTFRSIAIANANNLSKDKLGKFLYRKNENALREVLKEGSFEANSIKSQIMFDKYENQ